MARRQRDRSLVRPIGAQCRITMNLLPCALRRAQEPFPCTLRHWRLFFFSHEEAPCSASPFARCVSHPCLSARVSSGSSVWDVWPGPKGLLSRAWPRPPTHHDPELSTPTAGRLPVADFDLQQRQAPAEQVLLSRAGLAPVSAPARCAAPAPEGPRQLRSKALRDLRVLCPWVGPRPAVGCMRTHVSRCPHCARAGGCKSTPAS